MVSAEIVNAEIVVNARPEGRGCVLSLGIQPQEKALLCPRRPHRPMKTADEVLRSKQPLQANEQNRAKTLANYGFFKRPAQVLAPRP